MKNLIIKKIISLDNPTIENICNHFLPIKRMKLIDKYFPCSSKL